MAISEYFLKEKKRYFRLPFYLESAGIVEDHPFASAVVTGKLELCIRLGSTERISKEMIGGKLYHLHYPNAVIKVPDVPHIFTVAHPRDAVFYKWPCELEEPMKKAGFLQEPWSFDLELTPVMNAILRETRQLLGKIHEDGVADRLDLLALQMFEEVLLQRKKTEKKTSDADPRILRIASHFQAHFSSGIDLERVLRDNGISRRHFFRCWNEVFPVSPGKYIQSLKLDEGARLLRESSVSIWELSSKLGFSNSSYFCRIFRERFGLTPFRWRTVNRS